jgi:hypothetical protein
VTLMNGRMRSIAAIVLAALGAAAVIVAQTVMWSGQPGGEPLDSDVFRYYASSADAIRFGDVLWILGFAALVTAVALVLPRMSRGAGRLFMVGLSVCAGLFAISAAVAWALAGDTAAGAVDASQALARWQLETHLAQASLILMSIPMLAAAIGIDRDRRFGKAMTASGVLIALLLPAQLTGWTLAVAMVWLVAAVAFIAHVPRAETAAEAPHLGLRPAVAV